MDFVMLDFWGKTSSDSNNADAFHPLAWHSLDVAAVLECLLPTFPGAVETVRKTVDADDAQTRALLARLALLHDIGKFSIGFQAKAPRFFPACFGLAPTTSPLGDHTAIGSRLLLNELVAVWTPYFPGIDLDARGPLFEAACAHHGRPFAEDQRRFADHLTPEEIGAEGIRAACEFATAALPLIDGPAFTPTCGDESIKPASWLIAGLINLADWIGSNASVFKFEPPGDIADYWTRIARPRARQALEAACLPPPKIAKSVGYQALTGKNFEPSPLQYFAETVELAAGPTLFLIEDMTGAGKTEAALILAHRMMLAGKGDGLFMALPTMATANAIYGRLSAIYRRLFAAQARPSLVLAHGARSLHEGFRDSIVEVGADNAPNYGKGGDDCQAASAACAAWIADDRRKAFFADVGAGTIDQAFLAVLPSKFAALRQLGLSRRILIVDEAHAYGAYESEELARLLTFHAGHGGSAIILSATLPETVKAALSSAFRFGLREKFKRFDWPEAYPAATQLVLSGPPIVTPVRPRPDLPRSTPVTRLDSEAEALEALAQAARSGACAAYIRNTVDDVLRAAGALRDMGLDPLVFHARFAMGDRQGIEQEALRIFGPESTSEVRAGRILVASQVAEQSLDLDFDLLASDLAPIDLLIQRAGRLWRHSQRNRPLPDGRLLIVSPEPCAEADADWYRRAFPKAAYVYANHALLWRGARSLFAEGVIHSPTGVRALVESVYRAGALEDAPKGLEGRRQIADGKTMAEKSAARLNLLDPMQGYSADAGAWSADVLTPTRLAEQRMTLRLARWDGSGLSPWIAPKKGEGFVEQRRAWALSEIAIGRYRGAGRGAYDPRIEQAAATLEAPWREFGEKAVILPLTPYEGGFQGLLAREQQADTRVFYDPKVGLTF
jgi:CRISPR-associated endonuclease/helicase Cas3